MREPTIQMNLALASPFSPEIQIDKIDGSIFIDIEQFYMYIYE
jgi:hypothetical protein